MLCIIESNPARHEIIGETLFPGIYPCKRKRKEGRGSIQSRSYWTLPLLYIDKQIETSDTRFLIGNTNESQQLRELADIN